MSKVASDILILSISDASCLQLTQNSNAYPFGVVLLEVLCARPPINNLLPRQQINLADRGIPRQKLGQQEKFVVPLLKSFNLVKMNYSTFEARPLNGASIYYLSLNAVKAGPSPGAGHKFTDAKTLGGIKDSGPSPPGDGHKFTNAKTLGGIKNSGPSPGEGNKFTNAYTHGVVKKSGPSPGDGH
ncbi:precursor of CEP16-like [Olea europaea subsp. europaea]|uniref:Precursor of CEP16-like n=1 Tax=Olea europaea subsp. europaea TaxID=158383 RepID=A0A8S0Q8Q7_OLEEU|nr:precursor of CEP16-like [Olea europaea subsp. europaea]